MGVHHPYRLDWCADDEDPSQLIIRPGWDAPHVRCFPRTFCAWPCLLRQVGTVLGSPYDYFVAGLAYANPGSRHQGSKSVEAYQREFLHLSCYAGSDLPDDASRQEKFRDGLNSYLQLALALQVFPDFATMVNQTITLETTQFKYKGAQKRSREVGSSSGATMKKRVWIPHYVYRPTAPAPRPSYVTPRLPPPP